MLRTPGIMSKWTRSFVLRFINLDHSYFNLGSRKQTCWNWFFRWLVPPDQRWFFEGNRNICGQLWRAERQIIYETVRMIKPQNCFEVGTWRGGGSTFFISSALCHNDYGILHTTEINKSYYAEAKRDYSLYAQELLPYVRFHHGSSTEIYPRILTDKKVDLLFLDGLGPDQTLAEFQLFEPRFGEDATLIAHDWNNEKMNLLRPYIEGSNDWDEIKVIGPPKSVGLAIYQRNTEEGSSCENA